MTGKVCAGCTGEVLGTAECPTCLKLGLERAYFCTQDCFKKSWNEHKAVHKAGQLAQEQLARFNGFEFTGTLRPHPRKAQIPCPENVELPDYAKTGVPLSEIQERGTRGDFKRMNAEEAEKMRQISKLGRMCIDMCHRMIAPGVTGEQIDDAVNEFCREHGCYPSPLNYHRYPKSCCISPNESICHYIPDSRPLEEGDIVNVDISLFKWGFHTDLNETFFVGKVDDESANLVKGAFHALAEAIDMCKPGVMYRELGNKIEQIAKEYGLSVVRTYCGHGVGDKFHTGPNVPHYAKNKAVGVMAPGHVFTIEPMLNVGTWKDKTWPDEWTSVTMDGKRSAQFEHTLMITETGYELLTARLPDSPPHDFDVPEKFKNTGM